MKFVAAYLLACLGADSAAAAEEEEKKKEEDEEEDTHMFSLFDDE